MSYKDIEALKERFRTAQATRKQPKRKGKKQNLSVAQKAKYCEDLVLADVAFKEARITRDAITMQAHKAGMPIGLMAEALNITEATLYERLKVLRKTLGITTKTR